MVFSVDSWAALSRPATSHKIPFKKPGGPFSAMKLPSLLAARTKRGDAGSFR